MISFLWYENSQKVTKKSQNLLKVLPKTVLFRNIALIFSLEKPCYLENRVVREPCKRRSACICMHFSLELKNFILSQTVTSKQPQKIVQILMSHPVDWLSILFFYWKVVWFCLSLVLLLISNLSKGQ